MSHALRLLQYTTSGNAKVDYTQIVRYYQVKNVYYNVVIFGIGSSTMQVFSISFGILIEGNHLVKPGKIAWGYIYQTPNGMITNGLFIFNLWIQSAT
jgi:hypothetical protein